MATFLSGDVAVVTSNGVDLPASNWTLTITGNNKRASNARDGINRIAGTADATGSFRVYQDVEAPLIAESADPESPDKPDIRPGKIVTLALYESESAFWSLTAIIDDIRPSVEFGADTALEYEVNFSLQSGEVTYPIHVVTP